MTKKKNESLIKSVSKDESILTQSIEILRSDFGKKSNYQDKIADVIDDIYFKFMNMVGFFPTSKQQMERWQGHHIKTLKGTRSDSDMTDTFDVYYSKNKTTRSQREAKIFNPSYPIFRKFKKAFQIQADNRDNDKKMIIRYEIFITK